jgi:hypothetical protein
MCRNPLFFSGSRAFTAFAPSNVSAGHSAPGARVPVTAVWPRPARQASQGHPTAEVQIGFLMNHMTPTVHSLGQPIRSVLTPFGQGCNQFPRS